MESEDSNKLPPCRVCGDKASGLHFGANTCEACKAFFRRCLKKHQELECPAKGRCLVDIKNKAYCAPCRYQKCLQAGMSHDAIKTGRYTLERKADYVKEIKQRQVEQDLEDEKRKQQELQRRDYLEQVLMTLTRNSALLNPYIENVEKIQESQHSFTQEREILEEILGPMTPLPFSEYQEIYQSTGLDVDGRRDFIQTQLHPMVENSLLRLVAFAKALPKFKNLPISDQTALIKASTFEWWVLNAYRGVNTERACFTNQGGSTRSFEEMRVAGCSPLMVEYFFSMAGKIQALQLDNAALSLLAALCLTGKGRCDLQSVEAVSEIQDDLADALMLHLSSTGREATLSKIVSLATEFRTPQHQFENFGNERTLIYKKMGIKLSPILKEFFEDQEPEDMDF